MQSDSEESAPKKADKIVNIDRRTTRHRSKTPSLVACGVDVSWLSEAPNLKSPFFDAISLIFGGMKSMRSQIGFASSLRNGFMRFLRSENRTTISLDDINNAFINEFYLWLTSGNEKTLTKSRKYHVLRSLIEAIKLNGRWNHLLRKDLNFRSRLWPAQARHDKPPKIVNQDDFFDIYNAAIEEVKETLLKVEPLFKNLLNQKELSLSLLDMRSFDDCLTFLFQNLDLAIGGKAAIQAHSSALWKSISEHGGLLKFTPFLFPSPRLLTPFAILLAIHTRYNADVLLGSNLSDYSEADILGVRNLRAASFKARSHSRQVVHIPIDESPDNPHRIIKFIELWSSRIRHLAPVEHQSRLFLFVPQQTSKVVKGYGLNWKAGISGDITWLHNLAAFCKTNDLPHFNLRSLRLTAIDIGHELSGGDLRAAQALGNHSSPQVTNDHYKSDAARERNFQRLADIMQGRSRYFETEGLIDIRGLPHDADIGAATPGWSCLDPFASPFWSKNSLCAAYGYCPICPLATLDLSSPYSCAQAHNLLAAVRSSRSSMAPQAWLQRMGPVHEALLNRWLPSFSNAINDLAKDLELRPLPSPE